jgi:hypothetical protein
LTVEAGGAAQNRIDWHQTDGTAAGHKERYDKVNALEVGAGEKNDLVHLWFKAESGDRVQFRGTVSSIIETFSPDWSAVKYGGRADSGYKYDSFNRSLTFNFQVTATSRIEMKPIWQKLQYLSTMTMPSYYDDGKGYSGNLIKFRLGNLFIGKLAFFNSFTYTMSTDMPWEISPKGMESGYDIGELPRSIDVAVGLKILDDVTYKLGAKVYDHGF